ncbi:type II toxin-antitoxin system RelE/ParE family toxin [Adhaeretor mobilis]|uniref:Plasmid stabilization system protein n=1 Tax=Adhaeretor mobilis TaxID=1930276 RepID=A0A517MQY5_9BACT|nr:hypothetical protein HG15A2_05530 [Adhaeretor mobilis]
MTFSIELLPRAQGDFEVMFSYLWKRSPEGAESWRQAFELATKRLKTNPLSCGLAPENKHFVFELRQLLFKTRYGRTYRAVFRIDESRVSIFRLCGPGQAPLSLDEIPYR